MQRRAQGVIDYVFLIAVVVAVLLLMANYIKNSLSGRWRQSGDVIGHGEQYVVP